MKGYGPASYGDGLAADYDSLYSHLAPSSAALALLSDLARGGEVLELGIGTGTYAIPLVERGIRVTGVDASEQMLKQLHAKPVGAGIPTFTGDFASLPPCGPFRFAYITFSTFFALPSVDEQLRCFASVARVLEPGGRFLIEASATPTLSTGVSVVKVETDAVWLLAARYDARSQVIESNHIRLSGAGVSLSPMVLRWSSPSELDLMARAAGLTLENRWDGWNQRPFEATTRVHVSVYVKPAAAP